MSCLVSPGLAIEACDLLHFSQNGYLDLFPNKKEFSARIIPSLCRRMRRLVSQIENCGRESASCRLTRWLLERAEILNDNETKEFLANYAERLEEAYPSLPNGLTPFPFRRIFEVAEKLSELGLDESAQG